MIIRESTSDDFEKIWPIFHEVVAAGDTYSYDRDTSKAEAYRQWIEKPEKTFVAIEDEQVLGTYYIKTNHSGPSSHVCNCGYMVLGKACGRSWDSRSQERFPEHLTMLSLGMWAHM